MKGTTFSAIGRRKESVARVRLVPGTGQILVNKKPVSDFFERFDKEKYGSDGAPLHDPCVTAYLIKPELFSGRYVNVEIETTSALTRGMTVADWWRVTDRPANTLFMSEIDADGFFDLLVERLGRL